MTVLVACSFFANNSVVAGELALGMGGGVEYTSNPTRVPENYTYDVIQSVFAGLAYRERSPELTARINGLAEYRKYRNDTYGDEVVADLDAFVTWGIVPQTFVWRFAERFHQATIDPLLAETPSNRTNTNIFATGPDLRARLAPRNNLLIGARVGDVAVQDTVGGADLDNNRYSAHAGWQYEFSPVTSVSLNYNGIRVDYDDPVANQNFARHDYFLRMLGRPGPTRYELEWGTTRIYRDAQEPVSGRLARLLLGRQMSSNMFARLRLAGEYSDVGAELSPLVDPDAIEGTVTILPAILTTDLFYSKRADLNISRTGSFGLDVGFGWRELDYETLPDDRAEWDALVNLSYSFSTLTTVSLLVQGRHSDWYEITRTDVRYGARLRIGRQLARNWIVNFWIGRDAQDSTDLSSNYVDNRVAINLTYRTSPLFAAR